MIHPTAIIHPNARIAPGVKIGPYSVIDEHVRIGENCEIGPHVYITGATELGAGNKVHAGAVIGDLPQDMRFKGGLTGVLIGDNNDIREHVTIHRSNKASDPTRIGSHNLLMANCHIGHNSAVENYVIIANGTLLGGHVQIADRAFISGTCLLHQFARVGTLALMQGGAGISKDLPPYTLAAGNNLMSGLNVLGMRRAGFNSEERLEIRRLYHALFRSGKPFREALAAAEAEFTSEKARVMIDFLKAGRRGFCADNGVRDEKEAEAAE